MNNVQEKGKSLEQAVRAIESAIVRSFPGYEDKTFEISTRKIVIVSGVRHEIDIWVQMDLGQDYKSIFVFECKNWEDAVDKNEIILFSEKIDAVQAQTGFFVARSFSKYARAQAKKDSRIKLLLAKEMPTENLAVPFDFHFVRQELLAVQVALFPRGSSQSSERRLDPIDIANAKATRGGVEFNLRDFIIEWGKTVSDERVLHFDSRNAAEGDHEFVGSAEKLFEPNELWVDGKEIEAIQITARFRFTVSKPRVISYFEVETRGRFMSLSPLDVGSGASIQVGFIEK